MDLPRPNILWIVTTQWRAQATGYAGDVNAHTPSLDALASVSLNYTEAVTPHPFGPFARAALLTGKLCPENGIASYWDVLPPGSRTVAHELAGRGYDTAWFGAWHLGPRDPAATIVGEAVAKTVVDEAHRGGFAHWEGCAGGFMLNDPWLHGTGMPGPSQFSGYQADVLSGRLHEWLTARTAEKPWFAVLALESPHPPYGAPVPDGVHRHEPEEIVLADNVPDRPEIVTKVRREIAGYYNHIEALDETIGRLLAELPQETTVVFTSLHGDMHGAHGLFRKGWPHEESVRVPFLVRRPGRAGGVSAEAVSLLNLAAMTTVWADGRDWVCDLEAAHISMPAVVPLPFQCDRTWCGVRWPGGRKEILDKDSGEPWVVGG